jgi:glucose/arabinose dehydrogenase
LPSSRFAALITAATVASVLLAACSDDGGDARPGSDGDPLPTGPATGSGPLPGFGEAQVIARGLRVPWGIAFLPDGNALVAERESARILRVGPDGTKVEQVATVPGVKPAGEGGLLGLAVSPKYATDQLVYAMFTAERDNRIVRFRLDDADHPQVVFDGIDKASFHDGGRIAFGPDGFLYAGTGDAGNRPEAQDPDDVNGKILRMTPEGKPAPGNPNPDSVVYSLGHRNVQGLAWDDEDRMYAAEFGQNTWDEINRIEAGKNYGWPEVEGKGGPDKYTEPLEVWRTDDASPSGIAIAGRWLFMAALAGERLWVVPLDGRGGTDKPHDVFRGKYGRLRTVQVAPDGALWMSTSNQDGRGDPAGDDDRIFRFPPLKK